LEKEQKMVDSVTFGPARPVPGSRVQAVRLDAPKPAATASQAGPQHLSLAAALTQLGPPYDAQKIANGSYQINLGDIADGIIRFGGSDLR
jgi:Anti-sigma-28 factor, FlgM